MKDLRKTKRQLVDELGAARDRISELETALDDRGHRGDAHDTEGKYRSIFDQSQDVLIVVDTDTGCILSVNHTIDQVLGYDSREVVGKHFSDLYPSRREHAGESAATVRIHGAVIEAQEVLRADGTSLRMDLTATLIPWDDATTAFLFTLRDASERVQAETTIRENEEQLRTLTNAMPDMVCFKDGEGRWLQANDYTVNLFDLHGVDYRGKTDRELALISTFHHDTLVRLGSCDEEAWQTSEDCRFEEVISRSDGTVRVLDVIRVPFFRTNGVRKGLVVIGRDITASVEAQRALRAAHDQLELRVEMRTNELGAANEQLRREIAVRARAEEAAQLSEQRLRAILETANDCIFLKDRALKYTFVNPWMETLLGMSANSIIGRDDEYLYGALAWEHLRDVDTRVLSGEVIEEEHTRLVKGKPTTFLDIRAPMRSEQGDILGICGISRDITERTGPRRIATPKAEEYPSDAIRATMALARKAADSDSIVLLTGESGVGKDYFARFIHENSKRSDGPFFAINCAAVAPELAESELFGHEAGAFTGALGRSRGLLELAEGGTLLLNEIGEMPLPLQSKLLSFLDTRSFTRVGGRKSISVNARLIAATNRDMEEAVAAGTFRQDLFYRLNVLSIRVPPLRERREDLPILVAQIVAQLESELNLTRIPAIEPDAIAGMSAYDWPGNVRELRNHLERALIVSKDGALDLSPGDLGVPDEQWCHEVCFPQNQSLNEVTRTLKRALVKEALRRTAGSRKEAAQLLGISRHALRRQMESLGLMSRDDPSLDSS